MCNWTCPTLLRYTISDFFSSLLVCRTRPDIYLTPLGPSFQASASGHREICTRISACRWDLEKFSDCKSMGHHGRSSCFSGCTDARSGMGFRQILHSRYFTSCIVRMHSLPLAIISASWTMSKKKQDSCFMPYKGVTPPHSDVTIPSTVWLAVLCNVMKIYFCAATGLRWQQWARKSSLLKRRSWR